MAVVSTFHSLKPATRQVYHNNSSCTEGNNIERRYLAQGSGGRRLCEHCYRLSYGR